MSSISLGRRLAEWHDLSDQLKHAQLVRSPCCEAPSIQIFAKEDLIPLKDILQKIQKLEETNSALWPLPDRCRILNSIARIYALCKGVDSNIDERLKLFWNAFRMSSIDRFCADLGLTRETRHQHRCYKKLSHEIIDHEEKDTVYLGANVTHFLREVLRHKKRKFVRKKILNDFLAKQKRSSYQENILHSMLDSGFPGKSMVPVCLYEMLSSLRRKDRKLQEERQLFGDLIPYLEGFVSKSTSIWYMRSFLRKVVAREFSSASQQKERIRGIDFVLSTPLFQGKLRRAKQAFHEKDFMKAQEHLESAFQLFIAFLEEF